jgi:hypothetical protein
MRPEHMSLAAVTDGIATSGVLAMKGDLIYGSAASIRIPRGLALKIWSKHINGADVSVSTEFTRDIEADTVVWEKIAVDAFDADVEGDRNIEKRRPLLFRGLTGDEAVRFSYTQDPAGVSSVEINVEFGEIQ